MANELRSAVGGTALPLEVGRRAHASRPQLLPALGQRTAADHGDELSGSAEHVAGGATQHRQRERIRRSRHWDSPSRRPLSDLRHQVRSFADRPGPGHSCAMPDRDAALPKHGKRTRREPGVTNAA
ncbi:unnamed protein product [Prorocentrum cordatum]|uniref:Uncharacterized protein n=1 Tax=Prorocentrum cordatum TaxID=2364126 RepID=A0ABN9WWB6_9DINO|nr:unnamed protein product [Polarella glacialis]